MEQLNNTRVCRASLALLLAHFAQITPRTKDLASPADDDHTYVSVLLQSMKMGS